MCYTAGYGLERCGLQVAAVGAVWDRWGLDDGRPQAAASAALRYHVTPTPTHRAALEAALAAAHRAWLTTLAAETAARQAGQPSALAGGAQDVAFTVLSLGAALLTTDAEADTHLRNAVGHAALVARAVLDP